MSYAWPKHLNPTGPSRTIRAGFRVIILAINPAFFWGDYDLTEAEALSVFKQKKAGNGGAVAIVNPPRGAQIKMGAEI